MTKIFNDFSMCVVIPTYKREAVLLISLQSLIDLNLDVDILVINDDKSTPLNIPTHFSKHISVVQNTKKGVASARNYGAELSNSEWILFMDDDINVNEKVFNHIIDVINKNEEIDVLNVNWEYPKELMEQLKKSKFGRYMIFKKLTSLRGYSNNKWPQNKLYKTNENASYFLLVKRSVFEKSGGYNELFPHAGFEDFDFSNRLNKVFARKYMDMRITVSHNEFDRTDFKKWLKRRKNEGETRAVAAKKLNYNSAFIKYGIIKKIVYSIGWATLPFWFIVYNLLPNKVWADKFNYKFIDFLVGINMYKGYNAIK